MNAETLNHNQPPHITPEDIENGAYGGDVLEDLAYAPQPSETVMPQERGREASDVDIMYFGENPYSGRGSYVSGHNTRTDTVKDYGSGKAVLPADVQAIVQTRGLPRGELSQGNMW